MYPLLKDESHENLKIIGMFCSDRALYERIPDLWVTNWGTSIWQDTA